MLKQFLGHPRSIQRAALATPPLSWVLRLAPSFKLAISKSLFQKPPGHPDWHQVRQLEGPLRSGAWAPAAGPPGNCSSLSARLCCGLEGGWPGGAGDLSAVCSILESCCGRGGGGRACSSCRASKPGQSYLDGVAGSVQVSVPSVASLESAPWPWERAGGSGRALCPTLQGWRLSGKALGGGG